MTQLSNEEATSVSAPTLASVRASALALPDRPPSNLWRDAAIRFRKNRLASAALVFVGMLVLVAVFADLLAPAPYDLRCLVMRASFRAQSIGSAPTRWAAICSAGSFMGRGSRW